MKKIILSIDGMTCSACSNGLEKYLNKQDGITNASVNLVMNSAKIEYDEKKIKIDDLNRFVKEAGFKSLGKYKLNFEEKKTRKEKIKLIFIVIFGILTIYISMAHMWNLPIISLLDIEKNTINYAICLCVLSFIVIALGSNIIVNGIKNLIHKTPNMDTLVTIGVGTSFIYSLYETIQIVFSNSTNLAHSLYFETSAMIILFVSIGRYLETINKNKVRDAIQKLVVITPKDAIILRDGEEETVTLDDIKIGDTVICRPGGKIAVDGEIIERRNSY